ncbi:MAG: hypothetical protein WD314_16695, partial [Trueperaceae bacterium]
GGTVRLGPDRAAELLSLLTNPMGEALHAPLGDRGVHWLALARYLSYHVAELRSLSGRLGREPAARV